MLVSNVNHWRFVRINEAYARFYAVARPPVFERPLYVYVNLIESPWVDETYDTSDSKRPTFRWEGEEVVTERKKWDDVIGGGTKLFIEPTLALCM